MPFVTEFSCRLINPDKFERFIRQERESKRFKKKYSVLIGWPKDQEKKSEDQSLRYSAEIWEKEQAQAHCEAKRGRFEGLKNIKGGEEDMKEKSKIVEYKFVSPGLVELKEGHLISIEILREGTWKHEKAPNGVLVLTLDKLKEFVANFKDKIVGSELPIDLEHEIDPKGAVGWLKNMWLKFEGGINHLWGELDITDESVQKKIKEGSLKYFSPSLNFGWQDPETLNKYDLIRSGALTNYPYLKNMSPAIVNFSEVSPGKITPERENGHRVQLLEGQVKLLRSLFLTENKENKELKADNERLAIELKMSELFSEGRITPAEKYQVRELRKVSHNAGLIALKLFESRKKPVVEFGQKGVVIPDRQTGSGVQELVELCKSKDKKVRELALKELSEKYDKQRQSKGVM